MPQLIIFSDLDGTLLDAHTYSFEKALPALALLRQRHVPLVLCSSKTRREMELYRSRLDNHHPFITENGGGIYIPGEYFPFAIELEGRLPEVADRYLLIRLGEHYSVLRKALKELQGKGFKVRGFGDMTAGEVAELTGLTVQEAAWARERDFDETVTFEGNEEEMHKLCAAVTARGLHYTRGRFFHIMGNSDKGRAVRIVQDLYQKTFGDIVSVALGDSLNDLPMLEVADYPFAVQKPDGCYAPEIDTPRIIKAGGIGPEGWNKAVMRSLELSEPDSQR